MKALSQRWHWGGGKESAEGQGAAEKGAPRVPCLAAKALLL